MTPPLRRPDGPFDKSVMRKIEGLIPAVVSALGEWTHGAYLEWDFKGDPGLNYSANRDIYGIVRIFNPGHRTVVMAQIHTFSDDSQRWVVEHWGEPIELVLLLPHLERALVLHQLAAL